MSFSICVAVPCTSPGSASKPVRWSTTNSGMPERREDTTGKPCAMASISTTGIRTLARKRVVQRRLCDPAQLATEAITLFRGLQTHAPQVHLDVDASCQGIRVFVDALQLQQVMLNLLKNAFDAHRAGGLDLEPLHCRLTMESGQVCLSVQDRGPPLSEEQRAHLFEPFFTTKPDGLGLGLPICRTIVESHGGALRARPVDELGQAGGMVFEVCLPVAKPDNSSAQDQS